MNTAEICWLILLGGIVLVAVISFLSMIPEMRRYFRFAQHVSSLSAILIIFYQYVSSNQNNTATGKQSVRVSQEEEPMVAANEPFKHRESAVKEIHVIWMTTGLGCDGDSVSITAATQPSIEDLVMGEHSRAAQSACAQSGDRLRSRRRIHEILVRCRGRESSIHLSS